MSSSSSMMWEIDQDEEKLFNQSEGMLNLCIAQNENEEDEERRMRDDEARMARDAQSRRVVQAVARICRPTRSRNIDSGINQHGDRCCLDNRVLWMSRKGSRKLEWRNIRPLPHIVTTGKLKLSYQRLILMGSEVSTEKHPLNHVFWRIHSIPSSLEESSSAHAETCSGNDEYANKDLQEELPSRPLRSNELQSLLADSERTKLVKKLSEANQQNRFLKRQLHIKEDALVNFKSELAVLELEIQALVKLAEENTKSGIPEGSRRINGKYIQSHILSRLKAVHEKLKEQIKGVGAAQSKEVPLFWCGMAESVQVMGTFDGWRQGEDLSPEYTGSFTTFSTTLMLRPGRYEIKFLVDGEWKLSPELPTVGEGLTKNNLLIVK